MTRLIAAGACVAALAACSGTSTPKAAPRPTPTPPASCVAALDAADAGFTSFGHALQQIRTAFDEGMSGRVAKANADLAAVNLPDAHNYKTLEAECRAGQ